jgi:DNA-binding response OmpR family regulator
MFRIIIVENSFGQALAIRKVLIAEHPTTEVLIALSGDAANEMLKEATPDVVIVDVGLPDINGLDFCQSLKHSKELHQITVIVHSFEEGSVASNAVFAAGADFFIPKSHTSLQKLCLVVRNILKRKALKGQTLSIGAQTITMMIS